MNWTDILFVLLRGPHGFGGVLWVGSLFFFAYILRPVMVSLQPDVQKQLMPPLTAKLTRWIRLIVYVTLLTGLVLLGAVFHAGGIMFEEGYGWGPLSGILVAFSFLMFAPYDLLAKSALGRSNNG